jgi:hypothetical protein
MIASARIGGLAVLSFGAGQDSAALLALYQHDAAFRKRFAGRRFLAVMSDTKGEHPETYEYVAETQARCAALDIPFFFLTTDLGYHTGTWKHGLMGHWKATKTVGSVAFPSVCSIRLKLNPIYRWLSDYVRTEFGYTGEHHKSLEEFAADHGPIDIIIGYAKGEESRLPKDAAIQTAFTFAKKAQKKPSIPRWQRVSTRLVFPLIERGLDREGCQNYLRMVNETIPKPSQCRMCHWKSKRELLLMSRTDRAGFSEWVEYERVKIATWADEDFRRKKYEKTPEKFKPNSEFRNVISGRGAFVDGIFVPETLLDTLAEAERLHGHESTEELEAYRNSHGHCIRSKVA